MTNIKDLAKISGVSVTTVSRVLNNHPYVSKEKRSAVLKAIEDTNYSKNINAVHLSRGKTRLIGVVLPFSDHPYFSLLLSGIAKQALENNYHLVLIQTDYKKSKEMEALQMLKQKQIDGLIICSRACDLELIEEHLEFGPITLCEDVKRKSISTTFVSHYDVWLNALEYLYENGHRKIGYCVGRSTGPSSLDRNQAYRDFHEKYNLPYNHEYIIEDCFYFEDGERVMEQVKNIAEPPTALLTNGDQVAAGMIISSKNHQLTIPDDIAIIGVDNQPISKMMNITTIEIPFIEMGRDLFFQTVNNEVSQKKASVRLIERGTV